MILFTTLEFPAFLEDHLPIGHASPQYPSVYGSEFLIVPSEKWYEDEFIPRWNSKRIKNTQLKSCDHVVRKCIDCANDYAHKTIQKLNKDCAVGLIEIRVTRDNDNHFLCLRLFETSNNKVKLDVFEPQTNKYEDLETYFSSNYIRDVIL